MDCYYYCNKYVDGCSLKITSLKPRQNCINFKTSKVIMTLLKQLISNTVIKLKAGNSIFPKIYYLYQKYPSIMHFILTNFNTFSMFFRSENTKDDKT